MLTGRVKRGIVCYREPKLPGAGQIRTSLSQLFAVTLHTYCSTKEIPEVLHQSVVAARV